MDRKRILCEFGVPASSESKRDDQFTFSGLCCVVYCTRLHPEKSFTPVGNKNSGGNPNHSGRLERGHPAVKNLNSAGIPRFFERAVEA
jgi:hypothetical protein